MFLLCDDPTAGGTWYAGFDTDAVSPISAPDNLTFDLAGNIWISTRANELGANDGLHAAPTEGAEGGHVKQFFSSVPGFEVSGPVFTPDNTSLFGSVQHPGEGEAGVYESVYEQPTSRWPDGQSPPRPTVVVIQPTTVGARIGGGIASLRRLPSVVAGKG